MNTSTSALIVSAGPPETSDRRAGGALGYDERMLQKKYGLLGFEDHVQVHFNEAADAINALDEGLRATAGHLLTLDAAQAEQIKRLEAMVSMLMQVIVERGVLSADDLNAHIERAQEALTPAKPAPLMRPQGEHPYRGEGPKRAAAPAMVMCIRCQERVAAADTLFTEQGQMCSACHAKEIVGPG